MTRYEVTIELDAQGRWIAKVRTLEHEDDLWRQMAVVYTDRCETWKEAFNVAKTIIEGHRNIKKAITNEASAGTKE